MSGHSSDSFSKLTYLKLLRKARLTHAQYRVLVTMLTYADPDGANAHPGFARLVEECQMSRSTVSKSIAFLKKAGWLWEAFHAYPSSEGETASAFELRIPPYIAGHKERYKVS